MSDKDEAGHPPSPPAVLLMRTWNDGEAELVRELLDSYGLRCQVISDVTHAVFPLSVDGLGEIRILVAPADLEEAREILAQHRRQGMEIVEDGDSGAGEDATPEDGDPHP